MSSIRELEAPKSINLSVTSFSSGSFGLKIQKNIIRGISYFMHGLKTTRLDHLMQ